MSMPDERAWRRVLRLVAFLAPIVYVGILLEVTVHEVVGHGLTALALGGTFSGFTVHWDGMGWAQTSPDPNAGVWQAVAVLAAGIVVTTVVGASLCFWASRLRSDSGRGWVLAIIGSVMLLGGSQYAFWSGLQTNGPGDPSRIFDLLSKAGLPHVDLARTCCVVAAAITFLFGGWWSGRLLLKRIETHFGQGQPLTPRNRAIALLAMIVPGVILHYVFSFEDLAPGIGRLASHAGVASFLLIGGVLFRFPPRPFPRAFVLPWWHQLTAWCALGLLALPIHLWWHDGVHWGPQVSTDQR